MCEEFSAAEKAAIFKRELELIYEAILDADARDDELAALRAELRLARAEFEWTAARARVAGAI